MAAVYSEIYFEALWATPDAYEAPLIPTGYRFIVRDISAIPPRGNPLNYPLQGISFKKYPGNIPVMAWTVPYVQPGRPYHWDGRIVLDAGQGLYIETFDNEWSFTIMGYALTLP